MLKTVLIACKSVRMLTVKYLVCMTWIIYYTFAWQWRLTTCSHIAIAVVGCYVRWQELCMPLNCINLISNKGFLYLKCTSKFWHTSNFIVGAVPYTGSHYGSGVGPVLLTNMGCIGVERNLTDCSHSMFGVVSSSCKTHLYDASVLCPIGT